MTAWARPGVARDEAHADPAGQRVLPRARQAGPPASLPPEPPPAALPAAPPPAQPSPPADRPAGLVDRCAGIGRCSRRAAGPRPGRRTAVLLHRRAAPVSGPACGYPAAARGRCSTSRRCAGSSRSCSERINGRQLVWLDNAATNAEAAGGHRPAQLLLRARELQRPPRRAHPRGAGDRRIRSARATVAASSALRRARAIVFTRGATEAINLVAQAWGRQNIRAGDEIVTLAPGAPRQHRALAAARRAGRGEAARSSRSTTTAS